MLGWLHLAILRTRIFISKYSLVLSGFKKGGFGGSFAAVDCAAPVPSSYLSPPARACSEFPTLSGSPKPVPLVGSSSKVFDVFAPSQFLTPAGGSQSSKGIFSYP